MNIKNIFEKSIESLQFFSFLTEIYFSLLEKNDSENNQIQEFIDVLGKNYYWQSLKNKNYITSLKDYVFWQSKEIYLENMKKFVSHKCSASDFACTVYFLIQNDLKESKRLVEDFEFILEGFALQRTTNLTDDELRQIVKDILPEVQKYFTDEI